MNQSSIKKDKKDYSLVSVVVPAFNHEHYIVDCISSILEQDYPNIDLIVINDGSTDRTGEKIKETLKKNPSRFVYIAKENEGLIKTLNLGLQLARGKYFCELASDDMFLPSSITNRVHYLEEHSDIDVVFADAYRIDNNTKTNIKLSEGKKRYDSLEHTITDLIQGKAKIMFPTGMFRKAILERLGGFDEDFRYSEDVAIWYQLALHAKIGYFDKPVIYYRKHSDNTSSSLPFKYGIRKEKILALEKLFSLNMKDLENIVKKYLYREYIKFIKFSLQNPVDEQELRDVFRKATEMYPHTIKIRYYMLWSTIKGYLRE